MLTIDNHDYLTYKEVAKVLNTSYAYVARLVGLQKLRSVHFDGQTQKYISKEAVEKYRRVARMGQSIETSSPAPNTVNMDTVARLVYAALAFARQYMAMDKQLFEACINGHKNTLAAYQQTIQPISNAIAATTSDSPTKNALLDMVNHLIAAEPVLQEQGITEENINSLIRSMDLPQEMKEEMGEMIQSMARAHNILTVAGAAA